MVAWGTRERKVATILIKMVFVSEMVDLQRLGKPYSVRE